MHEYAAVICTYERDGRSNFLVQAVDSVLGQTLPAAELIVVSDGPSHPVSKALANRPVEIVERPKEGEVRARNAGIASSRSEWICFLDDDNLWHPDFLLTVDQFLDSNEEAKAVNASGWTFAKDGDFGADLAAEDLAGCLSAVEKMLAGRDTSYMEIFGRSFDLLLERHRASISTAAVRRDIVEKAGGFADGFTYANDWLFCVNVSRFVEWHYIPKRLVFQREHATRVTRTQATVGVETLRVMQHMWAEESLPTPAHRPLAAYGRDYRFRVQQVLWGAIYDRRPDLARRALALGMPLLPNWRDRVYALTPPQLTWRIERMSADQPGALRHSGAGRE